MSLRVNTTMLMVLVTITLMILMIPFASSTITASIVDVDKTEVSALEYDRYNVNFTSNSFKDNSMINPNVYLKICSNNSNEILNKYATLAYASESGNLTITFLELPVQITNVDILNCSYLDIDISSYYALYPGIPFLLLSDYENFTNYTAMKLNSTKLNGSFLVGASVDEIGGTTYFRVIKVFDSSGAEINQTIGNIIMTLISSNGSIVDEKLTRVGELTEFHYNFVGGERLFVNGLVSLDVKVFEPCGVINESGYYFLNSSEWNVDDECLIINASDITINFANKTIDGDGNLSYADGVCGVKVVNGKRVSIVDLRTAEFYRGVCVFNSSDVVVSGISVQVNKVGIYIHNSTNVNIHELILSNNETEFISDLNSVVFLENVRCPSANFSLESKDVVVRAVENPPPDEAGFTNVSQWLFVSQNGDSWANIKFIYSLPLPNNVLLSSVTVWKNNATNINGSWINGTWEMIPTSKIDPVNRYFYTDNITNFSIFAPMGEKLNVTQPEEVPSEGFGGMFGGGGGGGAPAEIPPRVRTTIRTTVPTPPQLDLELYNESIVLQQGESTKIKFNLTNVGDVIVGSVIISAEIRRGWEFSGAAYEDLKPKEVKRGELYLKVYDNEIPGTYVIAVSAKMENLTLDTEYLTVVVVPREKLPKLTILEAAPAVTFFENTVNDYEMLVKNTGDFYLENVTAKLINCRCIPEINGSYDINIGEQKTLVFKMKAGNVSSCRCVLVLRSNKYDALAFSPLLVSIVPTPPPMPLIFPIIVVVWTVLTGYVLLRSYRKRRAEHGE